MNRPLLFFLILIFSTSSYSQYYSLDDNTPAYYSSELQKTTEAPTVPQKNLSQLRDMLFVYQNLATRDWPAIPEGVKFKPGRKNVYVPLLRDRLTLTKDLDYNDGNPRYDTGLIEAVKNFQERHGLTADGIIGKNTRAQLNVTPQDRVRQIEMNLDRWGYLSTHLAHRYILVNIPDFQLYLVDEDQQVLSMKIIVGRPTRQTPELTSKITQLVFKPYWNVPKTIARKDIIKKAMDDPDYLDKNNIRVYDDASHKYEINDQAIDWQAAAYGDARLHFRQEPGENNSLGLVKFEFPNRYDVYLHDTPAKNLFSENARAFSSGCIRLEKPFELVNYLMKDNPEWNDLKMEDLLLQNKPTYISVRKPLPIIITYLTAWVDDLGKINFRNDVYGRDGINTASPEEQEANNPLPSH